MSLNFGNIWSTGSKTNTININNSRRKYTQNKLVLPVKRPTQKNSGMGTKSYWGTPTWFLFHSLAEKVNPVKYQKHYLKVWQFIKEVCYSLPCPFCKEHATSYVNRINNSQINTKDKLIDVLFRFHNDVNLRTGKAQMSREILRKYKSSNLNNILKLFLERFFVSYVGRRHFDDWIKNRLKDQTHIFWDFYRRYLL